MNPRPRNITDRLPAHAAGQPVPCIPDGVALVTGGARRVGRAIVEELASAGYRIAIHCHRSVAEAHELAASLSGSGVRAGVVQGDLADRASWPRIVRSVVDQLGRLDVLVNNASLFLTDRPDRAEEFDPDLWDRMFRVNLLAPVSLACHARPYLEASGRGAVVNLADAGTERSWPDHLAYCASKAALVNVTRGLARALAPSVRVNAVAPGIAEFPEAYTPELRESLVKRVPLGRPGTAQEVARLVRFLVDGAPYITGQVVNIDGGRSVV